VSRLQLFPQDPCKINILVWARVQHANLSPPRQHFRPQAFLQQQSLAHAVAHPLYSINGKLTTSHLERLILLFQHFEGVNGLRDALLGDLTRHLLTQLTPEKIADFAERHRLEPTHPEPWKKILIGGSDDHGGIFVGSAFTETPAARTPDAFLEHVRAGRCSAHGEGGTPLALSHGFYNTLSDFIQDRFTEKLGPRPNWWKNVFAFHGGLRRSSLGEKGRLHRGGVLSERSRARETGQHFALERARATSVSRK
jgi:hypothetical protein